MEAGRNISNLVLKPNIDRDTGQISMNPQMLRVLQALDGEKDLGRIAALLDMDMVALKKALRQLNEHRLIVKVDKKPRVLEQEVIGLMQQTLADTMGPIANILINDTAKKFNESIERFPREKAPELIEQIAGKIGVEAKRLEFVQAVIAKLGKG